MHETSPDTFGKSFFKNIVFCCLPGRSVSKVLRAFLKPVQICPPEFVKRILIAASTSSTLL